MAQESRLQVAAVVSRYQAMHVILHTDESALDWLS